MGESRIALPVPAVRDLMQWVHDRAPELRFSAEARRLDGGYEAWEGSFGLGEPEAPGAEARRLKWMAAILFALVGIAFYVLR
jgi:hypothetical protein